MAWLPGLVLFLLLGARVEAADVPRNGTITPDAGQAGDVREAETADSGQQEAAAVLPREVPPSEVDAGANDLKVHDSRASVAPARAQQQTDRARQMMRSPRAPSRRCRQRG